MKIQKKLLLSILVTVVLAFTMTIAVVSYNGMLLLKDKAIQLSGEMAQHYGAAIQNTIENKITVVEQMNHVLSSLKKDKIVDREVYNHVLQNMLANNKDILGMWVIYEPNALDGRDKEFIDKPGHDKTGRYIPYFNRGAGDIKLEALTDYDKEGAGDYFLIPKRTKKMAIIEPYVYKVNGEDVLMTSISMPLIENGEVVGVTGIDISLKEYTKYCESIRPFGTGYINLASNSGVYIYSRDGDLIGKNIKDNPKLPQDSKEKLLNLVKTGGQMDLVDEEHGYLRAIRPVQIGTLNQPWTISTTIPLERVNQETQKLTQTALIAAVVSILALSILLFLLVKTVIQKPLSILHQLISKISSTGQFYHRASYQSKDEFGELVHNMNQLSASLEQTFKETNHVMAAVAKGDFSQRLNLPLSGDLATLKENINFSVAKVDLTMHELSSVMQALKQGDFSKRVSPQIEGEFKHDVDSAMIAIETVIQDINETMSALAVSDFSKRVTVEAQGNLNLLKQNINTTINTIEEAIQELNAVMSAVAKGQLNVHIDNHKYQYQFENLMTSVHHATGSLRNLISQVVDSIRIISTAVREIACGNTDLASRTSEQAASLEETAASLESVMYMINANTHKARDANRSVMDSMNVAEQGGQVVHEVMSMMQDISASSQKISEIITIIDNISFQTNILSLNAAVESARAGEAGRGFAVVANEVRTLAQRSASAAKDIAVLITETVSKIQNASVRVEMAGGTMESIVKAVKNVTHLMSDITQASIEQSENISQVKIAVDQLNSITQQNAALVEEVSATSESLDHQTHDLELATQIFKI